MQEIAQLQSTANVIELMTGTAELQSQLQAEMRLENRIQARGEGCELKWEAHHVLAGGGSLSCYNCPHFNEERLICRVGRKQIDLIERVAGLKIADSLDGMIGTADARDFEACAELADFALA